MLWRNFGVNRHGRVVFYDYDEIEYLTDCTFRAIPPPPNPEAEMSGEPWYPVGALDVFPEEFETFLLGNPPCARRSCATTPTCSSPSSGSAARSRWAGARWSTSGRTPRRCGSAGGSPEPRRPHPGQFFTIQEPDRHRDPG